MRGSDRYCLGPTLMRKRSREGGRRRRTEVEEGGEGGTKAWGEIGKWGRDWSELATKGQRDEWRKDEGGGVMNGGPSSVTDAMANYSWSALQCTAGGADSVLSGQRISLIHLHWEEKSLHNLEQLWGFVWFSKTTFNVVHHCRPRPHQSVVCFF